MSEERHNPASSPARLDYFLVCGLGGLGQHCVAALKKFGVNVIGIDLTLPQYWEISALPDDLNQLIVGDCRQVSVLEQAKVQQCRAVLLVTASEQVNAETALAVRKLNQRTRLVVRSAKENLNQLLSQRLGNFIAFEAIQLPAPTFALAALGTETLGFFNLEGQWLQVVKHQLSPQDRWSNQRRLHELNNRSRRILEHTAVASPSFQGFYSWDPEATVLSGDTIVYVETTESSTPQSQHSIQERRQGGDRIASLKRLNWVTLRQQITEFWRADDNRLRQVGIVCGITVLCLLLLGSILYKMSYPQITIVDAFLATAILLLGGFGDLFGGFNFILPVPFWLRLVSLGMAIAGTAFVGILYGFLTERLLATRFQLLKRRPPVPQQDHVVVIGLGRVGRKVVRFLQDFKQPLVGVTFDSDFDPMVLPQMPLVTGNLKEALARANLATAKSVVVATDDEMLNLEVGLMAREANPQSRLVIRTFKQDLSDNLAQLLPEAQILCAYAVAAEAFVGAAFGENIISLFRLDTQTILVTEYKIVESDTLNGLLLSDVAYGYGVVPVLHKKGQDAAKLMPSADTRLAVGDRLVILAPSQGLQRIEQGKLGIAPKQWRVRVESALTQEAVFEGANALARISGCPIGIARDLMNHLPGTLLSPLYKHQAQRLVRELSKAQAKARLVPLSRH